MSANGGSIVSLTEHNAADLTWWHYLQWNISACSKTNEANTAYWTFACMLSSCTSTERIVFE